MGQCYRIYPHLYKFEEYGVPQARHRMIIVGIRNDQPYEFKIPSTAPYKDVDNTCKEALEVPPIPKDATNNELTKQSKIVEERLSYIKPDENAFTADIPEHLQLVEQYPGLWLYYCSEEPSMDLYETNDGEQRFFKDRYRVEYYLKGREDCCYLQDEQALRQALLELIGKEYGQVDLQELERRAGEDLAGKEYIRIIKFVVK